MVANNRINTIYRRRISSIRSKSYCTFPTQHSISTINTPFGKPSIHAAKYQWIKGMPRFRVYVYETGTSKRKQPEKRRRPTFSFKTDQCSDHVSVSLTEVLRLENDTHPKSSHPHLQPKPSIVEP